MALVNSSTSRFRALPSPRRALRRCGRVFLAGRKAYHRCDPQRTRLTQRAGPVVSRSWIGALMVMRPNCREALHGEMAGKRVAEWLEGERVDRTRDRSSSPGLLRPAPSPNATVRQAEPTPSRTRQTACAGVDGLVRRPPREAGSRPCRFGLRMLAEQAPEHRVQQWFVGMAPVAVDEDAAHQLPKDSSTGGLGCAPKGQPHQHVVQGALTRRTGRPIVGCAFDDSRTVPAVELDPSLPKCLVWGAIVGLNFQDKP